MPFARPLISSSDSPHRSSPLRQILFGGSVSFTFDALSQTPPSSPVPFASLTSNNLLTELPAVDMEVEVVAGLASFSNVSLSPSGHMLQYVEAGLVGDTETFSVHAVDELVIEAAFEDQGMGLQWFLISELEGDGLSSVALMPPVGPQIPLTDLDMLGQSFDFESSGFSSLANLQATYPAGTWTR